MKTPACIAFLIILSSSPVGLAQNPLAVKSRQAEEAMRGSRFDEAIVLYEELVKALPAVPGLKMNLGFARYMAGRFREAVAPLQEAVKADPALTDAWLFLGASHQHLGNPARAVPALQKYLQLGGKDPRARQFLADGLLSLQKHEEAARQFQELLRLESSNPRAWYGLGKAYESLAADAFGRIEKSAPESAWWFSLVAASRAAQRQYQSAFFFYRKALEKKPDLRGIHIAVSQIYRRTGNEEWALEEEKKELALGIPDCSAEKTVCDFLAGRFHEVLASVRVSDTPESWYWRAQACNQLALGAFSQLEELPPSVELHELMAVVLRNQGKHLESVKEWKAALALSPDNPLARKELAVSLILAHDYGGARPIVEELLRKDPNSADLNFLAGEILLNMQKPSEAVPVLTKALSHDPSLTPARASLGRAHLSLGQAAKAVPLLESALDTDQDGSLHYQLARAYRLNGQAKLADQMLRKYEEIQKALNQEKEELEKEVRITPP